MTYRTFEHTAHIGIEVEAPDLDQAFTEAAYGLTEVITGGRLGDTGKAPRDHVLELSAPDLETLLVRWLSELLYRFDAEDFLVGATSIEVRTEGGRWRLSGKLAGEAYDPQRHVYGSEVKAITYHGLAVERGPPVKMRFIVDL